MTNTTTPVSTPAAVFAADFVRLKQEWSGIGSTPGGDEASYFTALRHKFDQLAAGKGGKLWYLPHSIFTALLAGSPAALATAKQEFLQEWTHGEKLNRNFNHYWNSLQFKTGDRWICAAMLAQLLVLWDWLAVAGVWNEAEIDAAANEALDVAEAYLEPHLKGRGHMPLLPDPINQTAACVCGLLYVGYMFGLKWQNQPRAQRMYAFARNLLADCLGQYPANGYDSDGFTYLRHIHLQVHTLSVALLEDVEGGDWYHRRFAPHNLSLADLNAMQLDFVTPAGFTWPLGRYGYCKSWNLFGQALAARRTGDPRYLQVAKRDNHASDYKSPWLGMDLVFGLLWYPKELDQPISHGIAPTGQKRRVVEDSWAVFTNDEDRMLAVATWPVGKAPHFFMEAHGSPLILGGMESWDSSNGVQCDPQQWGRKSWLTPRGQLLRYCDIPGLQAASIDSAATYPPAVGVQRAARVYVNCAAGMVVSERFVSTSPAAAMWQAAVWANPQLHGAVATVRGWNNVTLRAVSAQGDWKLRAVPERKIHIEGLEKVEPVMLQLEGQRGHGAFDVLLDWRQGNSTAGLHRVQDDLLAIATADQRTSMQVLLPGANQPRKLGDYQTDANLALLQADGRLCVAGARSVQEGDIERIWASLPVDVTLDADAYWISGLKYGEFVTLRSKTHFVCVRVGNGIEVWGRSPTPLRIHVRHPAVAVQLNGRPADAQVTDGWTAIDIPDTAAEAAPAGAALAAAVAKGATAGILRALHELQQAMAWEYAGEVRKLFTWDAAKEPVLPMFSALKTEATYVRLEAAAAAMCLGDRAAIPALIDLLRLEAHRDYAKPGSGVTNDKWWGFPARSVTLEALMVLHGTAVLKILDEVLDLETWPHGIDAVARARVVFG